MAKPLAAAVMTRSARRKLAASTHLSSRKSRNFSSSWYSGWVRKQIPTRQKRPGNTNNATGSVKDRSH